MIFNIMMMTMCSFFLIGNIYAFSDCALEKPTIWFKKISVTSGLNRQSTAPLSHCHAILPNRSTSTYNRKQMHQRMVNDSIDNVGNRRVRLHFSQKNIENISCDDRSYDNMGLLMPLAEKLDAVTGDWALSYADLSPATPRTPEGVAFLATNICYAFAGLALGIRGDFLLGGLTEMAGVVSFWYHYSQLEFGAEKSEVRLALLTDYIFAGAALITGFAYMVQMGITCVPTTALVTGAVAIICLSLCWIREYGISYIFWHSLWHIFSALTGYMVGQAHLSNIL